MEMDSNFYYCFFPHFPLFVVHRKSYLMEYLQFLSSSALVSFSWNFLLFLHDQIPCNPDDTAQLLPLSHSLLQHLKIKPIFSWNSPFPCICTFSKDNLLLTLTKASWMEAFYSLIECKLLK